MPSNPGAVARRIERLKRHVNDRITEQQAPEDPTGPTGPPRLLEEMRETCWVRPKGGGLIRFEPWMHQARLIAKVQHCLDTNTPGRFVILKSRQRGFTTVIELIIWTLLRWYPWKQGLVMAHEQTASTDIWRHIQNQWAGMSDDEKAEKPLERDDVHDYHFTYTAPHGSNCVLRFAGKHGVGVGGTREYIEASEFAKWPNGAKTWGQMALSLPNLGGTLAFKESTAEGNNFFKTDWDQAVSGASGWDPIFASWWEDPLCRISIEPGEVFELDEQERAYVKKHARLNLDLEQLKWLRGQRNGILGGSWELQYQEEPATADEAFAYSGERLFKNSILQAQIELVPERTPVFRGEIEWKSVTMPIPKLVPADDGYLQIWQLPEEGRHYYIGADPAEGGGGDYSEAVVMQEGPPAWVVAHYRRNYGVTTVRFGEIVYALGMLYNNAMLVPEINTVGQTLIPVFEGRAGHDAIRNHPYPNMFFEWILDRVIKQQTKRMGLRNTSTNRLHILNDLKQLIAADEFECPSIVVLQQMQGLEITRPTERTSNRRATYKLVPMHPDHITNQYNDDAIFATALAYHGMLQVQLGRVPRPQHMPTVEIGEALK